MFSHRRFLIVSAAFVLGVGLVTVASLVALGGGAALLALLQERLFLIAAATLVALGVAYVLARRRDRISYGIFGIAAGAGALVYWGPVLLQFMHVSPHVEDAGINSAVMIGKLVGSFLACAVPFLLGWFAASLVVWFLPRPVEKVDPDVF